MAALGMAGCGPSAPPAAERPDGGALYAAYCASCHGANGRNDRSGALPAMRLADANALAPDAWLRLAQQGRGQMPAFGQRLTPAQLETLRRYIRRLTSP